MQKRDAATKRKRGMAPQPNPTTPAPSHPPTTPPRRTTPRTHRLHERTRTHRHAHTGAQAPTGACRRGLGERHPSVTTPETTCDHPPYHPSTERAQSEPQPPQGLMLYSWFVLGLYFVKHSYNLLNHHGRTPLAQRLFDLPSPEQHGLQPYSTYQ